MALQPQQYILDDMPADFIPSPPPEQGDEFVDYPAYPEPSYPQHDPRPNNRSARSDNRQMPVREHNYVAEGDYAPQDYAYQQQRPAPHAPSAQPTRGRSAMPIPIIVAFLWAIGLGVIGGIVMTKRNNLGGGVFNSPSASNDQIPVRAGAQQAVNAAVPQSPGTIAPLFTPEVQYWSGYIAQWSAEYDLDANIIATLMQIESCGYQEAESWAGAQGLFQVMPFHFGNGESMREPHTNAKRGINYMNERLVQTNGNTRMAFAGYNGGHVAASGEYNWVQETRDYVKWGEGIYGDAQQGLAQSETLTRWLAAGGASLCEKARVEQLSRR